MTVSRLAAWQAAICSARPGAGRNGGTGGRFSSARCGASCAWTWPGTAARSKDSSTVIPAAARMAVICSVGGLPGPGCASASGSGCPAWNSTALAVDRFPVHRDPQQQAGGAGHLGQAGQQVLEQDVVGGQRHGLGQGGVQAGAGGQPLAAVGAVQAAGDRVAEPSGHVGVAGGAAGQQRVQVFQGPGVAAGQPPHLLQLAFVQPVQGGQRPGQLHRLGLGQRPQLPERQATARPRRAG